MNKKENMNNKKNNTLLIVALLLSIIANFAIYHFRTPPNINKVDTIFHTDTIYEDTVLTLINQKPILKIVKETKIDTFYTKDGKDTLLKTENKQYQDTFTCAKDSIIIQNFISGINSKLDSTKVNWKRQETIVTNTVEITKYIKDKKLLHIGPTVSVGYDPINKQFGMMVGIGVNLDIW